MALWSIAQAAFLTGLANHTSWEIYREGAQRLTGLHYGHLVFQAW